jgi:hypothetical protein
MDDHLLLCDFIYYSYAILPLYFDQQLIIQSNIRSTVDISYESLDFTNFKYQPILFSVCQSSEVVNPLMHVPFRSMVDISFVSLDFEDLKSQTPSFLWTDVTYLSHLMMFHEHSSFHVSLIFVISMYLKCRINLTLVIL